MLGGPGGTPDIGNDEIQSSSEARDSSSLRQICHRIQRKECSQNQKGFITCCFYKR
jgi:hypothetical protein